MPEYKVETLYLCTEVGTGTRLYFVPGAQALVLGNQVSPPYLIDPCIYNLHTVTNQSSDVPKLYEGDMALTEEQALLLGKTSTPAVNKFWDQAAHTRGAIRNPAQLWPDGIIPFKISSRIGIITYALFRLGSLGQFSVKGNSLNIACF